jgi:hypothetical protein
VTPARKRPTGRSQYRYVRQSGPRRMCLLAEIVKFTFCSLPLRVGIRAQNSRWDVEKSPMHFPFALEIRHPQ